MLASGHASDCKYLARTLKVMSALALSFKDMSDSCQTSHHTMIRKGTIPRVQGMYHIQVLLLRLLVRGCLTIGKVCEHRRLQPGNQVPDGPASLSTPQSVETTEQHTKSSDAGTQSGQHSFIHVRGGQGCQSQRLDPPGKGQDSAAILVPSKPSRMACGCV